MEKYEDRTTKRQMRSSRCYNFNRSGLTDSVFIMNQLHLFRKLQD